MTRYSASADCIVDLLISKLISAFDFSFPFDYRFVIIGINGILLVDSLVSDILRIG